MRIVSLAVALALGSGCSIYFGGEDDEPPPIDQPCDTPNPGCREDDCGPWCGDEVYACVDGEWESQYVCDTCLGGVEAYPAFWTLVQTTTAPAGCELVLRGGAELLALAPQATGTYAQVSAQDPTLIIDATSTGAPIGGYPGCATRVAIAFTDTARVDGVDIPVTGRWDLDLQSTREIDGTLTGQVGLCLFEGTVRGGWDYVVAE